MLASVVPRQRSTTAHREVENIHGNSNMAKKSGAASRSPEQPQVGISRSSLTGSLATTVCPLSCTMHDPALHQYQNGVACPMEAIARRVPPRRGGLRRWRPPWRGWLCSHTHVQALQTCCMLVYPMQCASPGEEVQRQVAALEQRLRELEQLRSGEAAENFRLHAALLHQTHFLPTNEEVNPALHRRKVA